MKNTKNTFDKAPDIGIVIDQIPGLNTPPNDFNLLFNKPTNTIAAGRVDMTNATTTSTDYAVGFRPRRVLIRSAKSGTNIAVMSESYTYDGGSTYTIAGREDTSGTVAVTQTYMDSQNGTAVLLKNNPLTTSVIISTCTITDTGFTLSAPTWTGYSAFSFHYECI